MVSFLLRVVTALRVAMSISFWVIAVVDDWVEVMFLVLRQAGTRSAIAIMASGGKCGTFFMVVRI
jgi:hypothetical protein